MVLSPAYILESSGEFSNILIPGPSPEDSDARSVVGFRPKELRGGKTRYAILIGPSLKGKHIPFLLVTIFFVLLLALTILLTRVGLSHIKAERNSSSDQPAPTPLRPVHPPPNSVPLGIMLETQVDSEDLALTRLESDKSLT